jgi:hypothetical protein
VVHKLYFGLGILVKTALSLERYLDIGAVHKGAREMTVKELSN